ncbi:MAG: hypothetical protein HZA59_15305 [Hydrogenophilales bacterium]|nr:hypothetical protein [Hydrogenophilales bacterium]
MSELPPVVETTGWSWERFTAPVAPSRNFWLGVDREGNRWLTKLTGAFYSYREIIFARLAQAMNWSCQSSVFMRVDKHSAQVLGVPVGEIHAAHWFLMEHLPPPYSFGCALEFLVDRPIRTVEDLMGSEIAHLLDWPKSEFAAYVFGGNEPPGRLFTTAHEFVIIDSEQMFATGPCNFDTAHWWNEPDGRPSISGRALALEVCSDLAALSEYQVQEALREPYGVSVRKLWPIAPKLRESRRFAAEFRASHERT